MGRALELGVTVGSVGCHWMTEKVDDGPVIYEEYCDIRGANNREEVYEILYPLYRSVLLESLRRVENGMGS